MMNKIGKVDTVLRDRGEQTQTNKYNPDNWIVHGPYHWGRWIKCTDGVERKLDFWPSKDKWMFGGRVRVGGLDSWLEGLGLPL